MISIERVTHVTNDLGEGPVWDAEKSALWWVDSYAGEIFRLEDPMKVDAQKARGVVDALHDRQPSAD